MKLYGLSFMVLKSAEILNCLECTGAYVARGFIMNKSFLLVIVL